MTNSNGDLVEKVAQAMYFGYRDDTALMETLAKDAARAAIAAVLDDLMADPVLERQEWHAVHKWLATKRRELGLASPMEPGDAPNAPEGITTPENGSTHSAGFKMEV